MHFNKPVHPKHIVTNYSSSKLILNLNMYSIAVFKNSNIFKDLLYLFFILIKYNNIT